MHKHPYIIAAPDYAPSSAGVTVLYKLCHLLNAAGYPAYIFKNFSFPRWNAPTVSIADGKRLIEAGAIVVYPEVVAGNPLQGKTVARFILNTPGLLGGEKSYAPEEIRFCYDNSLLQPGMGEDRILCLPVVDTQIFYNDQRERTLDYLVYFGKHKKVWRYPEKKIIYRHKPEREKLGELLRSAKKLICYDNFTIFSFEATLCGCPVVIMPDGSRKEEAIKNGKYGFNGMAWGTSKEEWERALATLPQAPEVLKKLEAQSLHALQNFIKITQDAAQKHLATSSKKSLSIIIPSCNGREQLKNNLPPLLTSLQNYPDSEIIVVDNGSDDGSASYLKENFSQLKVLFFPQALGFARACNAGAAAAANNLLCFLNSDVKVEPDFLNLMIEHFSFPQVFAITPRVLRPTQGNINESLILGNFAGGVINALFSDTKNLNLPLKPRSTFSVCGAAFMVEREKFNTLGGFDELLSPFYYDETDLSYRALKQGWKIIYEPRATVYHQHDQTIGKHFKKQLALLSYRKNQYLCTWKNILDKRMLAQHVFQMIIPKLITPNLLEWQALFSAVKALPEVFRQRRRQRLLRNITDLDIQAGERKTVYQLTDREVFKMAALQKKRIELQQKVKKILVIRPDALGDVVLTLPAIQALKEAFPEAKITALVSEYTAPLLKGHPAVSAIIHDYDLKKQQFDLAVNFFNSWKDSWAVFLARIPYRLGDSARILTGWMNNLRVFRNWNDLMRHEVEHNLDLLAPLGIEEKASSTFIPIDPVAKETIEKLLEQAGIESNSTLFGIHIGGSANNNKPWNTVGYAEVIDWLAKKPGMKVVLIGGEEAAERAEKISLLCTQKPINLVGKTDLPQLSALISKFSYYLGSDTGPTHIAAALNIPLVALFLAKRGNPLRYGPWGARHRVIKNFSLCKKVCTPPICRENVVCMEEVSPPQVIAAIEDLWEGKGVEEYYARREHWKRNALSIALITSTKKGRDYEESERLYGYLQQQRFYVQKLLARNPRELLQLFIQHNTNIIYHSGFWGYLTVFLARLFTGTFQSNTALQFRDKNKLVAYCGVCVTPQNSKGK